MATQASAVISPEPYGSYILAERKSGAQITAVEQMQILQEYLDLIQAALVLARTSISGAINEYGPIVHSGVIVSGRWFQTTTPAKWEPSLNDTANELLLISVAKNRVAFYASDPSLRKMLLTSIGNVAASPALAGLSKISSSRLIAAFLDAKQLKAMWLSGTHKSVQVKADSKVLSGSDLKYALDPLGDSSYLAAAARQENMGVSLRGSAVWTRPHKTILSFADDVRKIFEDLDASGTSEANLPILANELSSFISVELPFDFDVAAPEALRLKAQQRQSVELSSQFSFQIFSCSVVGAPAYAFDLDITPWTHTLLGGTLRLQVEPSFTCVHSDSVVVFEIIPVTTILLPWMTQVINALEERPEIFRVFYSSGHTIAAGALSIAHPMDIDFHDWMWMSFSAMPGHPVATASAWVHVEKPKNNDLTRIWNAPNERSLFAWFVRTLNDRKLANDMGLEPLQNTTQDVWLFCDDDAGEVADFVHVFSPATGNPRITLIHIKASNNDSMGREMVAGPYEVVCGQAIKNLRYLPSLSLADRLSSRIFDIKRPLWNSTFVMGVAPSGDRDDFYSVLCDIGAEATYAVLIIQPHVTKAAFNLPKNTPMVKGTSLYTSPDRRRAGVKTRLHSRT